MVQNFDFIAIGDTVTDAFIKLKNPAAHVDIDRGTQEICMRFADKIPYEDVFIIPAVGNSANAAVAASRLGLSVAFVSNVGGDYFGKECIEALAKEKVSGEFINVHEKEKTNYHYVLWYEDDRTILIKHETYNYALPDIGEPKWIYFSSMAENSLDFHMNVEKYLKAHPQIKLAFQPGTFQMKFGKEKIAEIYRSSEVVICNKEESQRILGIEESDIKNLIKGMAGLGPKIVVITDGVKGAYAFNGSKTWFMPPYPDPKPPFERTGAGDAFSSTFIASLALGKSIEDSLRIAPINSMSVVQYVGAREGLLNMEALENFLKEAPADYLPKEI